MFKLLLLCGGPSPERDISLNSARSLYDNIREPGALSIDIIFVDQHLGKHRVSDTFLYSNTTADFDFKLETEGQPLDDAAFSAALSACDLVFPAMHGVYGEDGQIQALLEAQGVPCAGSPAAACRRMYSKRGAEEQLLRANGLRTTPKLFLSRSDTGLPRRTADFFAAHGLDAAVVKPIEGGSSIGVSFAADAREAARQAETLLESPSGRAGVLVEAHCKGREFTVIILENHAGQPVALIPTEIEVLHDGGADAIFDKRRKYLATTETHYYCPPRFTAAQTARIREQAQRLFALAGARDFLRIDGWLLDDAVDGEDIYFSDFNPISGMEQNSFLFQQGARAGMTHRQLLAYILRASCRRHGLTPPRPAAPAGERRGVRVLFGGWTSERQVSLMSGTNVWLKLTRSARYAPAPYLLLRREEDAPPQVLALPYAMALNHTVEEIVYQYDHEAPAVIAPLRAAVREALGLTAADCCPTDAPPLQTLDAFIGDARTAGDYVFLGLHGGFGEDGSIQARLEAAGVPFNGSGSAASRVCMDKYVTGELVTSLDIRGLRTGRKRLLTLEALLSCRAAGGCEALWHEVTAALNSERLVVKPVGDGCSTGVVILDGADALRRYAGCYAEERYLVPAGTFFAQAEKVTLSRTNRTFILEEFTDTDEVAVYGGKLRYRPRTGWIELTVGVLERGGVYYALQPSITVAAAGILSVEEKFQGGTGVNITPPPPAIMPPAQVQALRERVERAAAAAGVADYCRIDVFANVRTGETVLIEINTLPGLSPSTVLFQQGAKESPPMLPVELLERIME